jgi:tripartite-type tricarboxylate transporter receptor subunit TctC
MRMLRAALALLLAVTLTAAANAQDAYPSKQINLVVPFAPGGGLDLTVRALAPVLQKVVGQPVVVTNKTGAAGAIATQSVSVAPPDGYTVLVGSNYLSSLPAVDSLFDRKPAFSRHDFQPLALLTADPGILFVNAELPWKTFKDLAEDKRAKEGTLVFSSSGIYGATHVPIEMMLKAAGLKMRHLPTTGGGPALTAVMGGNAQVVASFVSVGLPHYKAGKIRALAQYGEKRHPEFPDVPTLKELGYDVEYYPWVGLFMAKGVPEPILQKLADAVGKAATDPEFKAAMDKINAGVDYRDRKGFAAFFEKDSQMIETTLKAIGKVE